MRTLLDMLYGLGITLAVILAYAAWFAFRDWVKRVYPP